MSLKQVQNNHNQETQQNYKKIQNYIYYSREKLGQGNFSQVYKGIDQNTNKYVAIKVIKYTSLTNKVSQQLLKNQVMILRQLNHQNIIKCMDVFTSKNNCYIVTDFYQNGDLQHILEKKKYFQEKQISKIIYGIYKALIYLNQKNIVHRDLKPANILISKQGIPKIGDFGFAVKSKLPFKDINIGSPIYMSPQGLLKHQYGPKNQVWSFGVLIYQLLHGYTPLSFCKDQKILKQTITIMPKFKQQLSNDIKKLLELCFICDIKQRPDIKQLANTKYISKLILEFQKNSNHNSTTDLYSTYHTVTTKHINTFLPYINDILTYQQGLSILQYCRLIYKTIQIYKSIYQSKILIQWLLDICGSLQYIKLFNGNSQNNNKLIITIKQYYIKYKKQLIQGNINIGMYDVIVECQNMRRMVLMGNMSNIGNMGNMGSIGNIGSIGGIGNMGSMGNIGAITAIGNIGNIGIMSHLGNHTQGHIHQNTGHQKLEQSHINMLIGQTQMLQKFAQTKKLSVYAKVSQVQKYLENIKMKKIHGISNTL